MTDPVVALSAGSVHTLALTRSGRVYAWGDNSAGQLGVGHPISSTRPLAVQGLPAVTGDPVVAVAAGSWHSLALTKSGHVYAWGNNSSGELGNSSTADSSKPVVVPGLPDAASNPIVAVAAGNAHSLALTRSGSVYAWGANDYGQLGSGHTMDIARAVAVQGLPNPARDPVVSVAAGGSHSLALSGSGTVYAWGANGYGQLGTGGTIDSAQAVAVQGLPDPAADPVIAVAAGYWSSLALTSSGKVYAWGYNGVMASTMPVAVQGLPDPATDLVVAMAGGYLHSLALSRSGNVYAWGYNDTGQLGTGSTTNSVKAVAVRGLPSPTSDAVAAVSAGSAYSLALTTSGRVYAWGANDSGQLGTGNTTDGTRAAAVPLTATR